MIGATEYRPAKAISILPERKQEDIKMIIIHHTGAGILRKTVSPLQAAIRVYTEIMDFCPHYLIGYNGEIIRFVPDNFVAWHAGAKSTAQKIWQYSQYTTRRSIRHNWLHENINRFHSWRRVYGDRSPLDLQEKLNFNQFSIGIELLAVEFNDYYYHNQLITLTNLVNWLCEKYNIITDKYHITTHSLCQPYSRITQAGFMWDPPESKFNLLKFLG
jgi:N-acetyl-anhydromuramyl-L-alanine amidase AmpD